jgi:hypothetical protein
MATAARGAASREYIMNDRYAESLRSGFEKVALRVDVLGWHDFLAGWDRDVILRVRKIVLEHGLDMPSDADALERELREAGQALPKEAFRGGVTYGD